MNRKFFRLNNLCNHYEVCSEHDFGLFLMKTKAKHKALKMQLYDVNLYIVMPGILIGFSIPEDLEVNNEIIENLHF